jgi:hypothetical protein
MWSLQRNDCAINSTTKFVDYKIKHCCSCTRIATLETNKNKQTKIILRRYGFMKIMMTTIITYSNRSMIKIMQTKSTTNNTYATVSIQVVLLVEYVPMTKMNITVWHQRVHRVVVRGLSPSHHWLNCFSQDRFWTCVR